MKKEAENTAIYNPVYNEHQRYLHHKCSECGFCIELDEWQKQFKYCPNCATEIIRYGEPIFDSKPDFSWLEPYKEVWKELKKKEDEVERHLEYLMHIKLCDFRYEFLEKLSVAEDYFEPFKNDEYRLCQILRQIHSYHPHYTTIRKLKKEFEEK